MSKYNENIFSSDESSDEDFNEIKFQDEDEPENEPIIKNPTQNIPKVKPNLLVGNRTLTDYILIDAKKYSFKNWKECFPDNNVKLRSLIFNPAWNEFFDSIENRKYFNVLEEDLSNCLKSGKNIVPYPELLFNIFNVISPKKIKVVIIGQDPYIAQCIPGVPQAMGLSFSVPMNCEIPPSLKNIYKNLLDFKNIVSIPDHGCLASWVVQGCFLFNAALTTILKISNAHKKLWENFAKDLLKYITDKYQNLVFIVWGKFAHEMCQNIDPEKHCIITSSHPSPLAKLPFGGTTYGKNKKYTKYPLFKDVNHFGIANKYLKSHGKGEILWDVL
ncbi:Uracil-DNA glycosylase family 1 [Acanthamoeba polyphaga moumouvirus]|uniref:Uracil-DNA glycosylase family 1 n=1 Tax=Acanthamoeba polyphaga moumouvirus TaxID=1269028 RepID=L7RCQ7_9VIRU|nr:Uracil-DNA glycosylase family 1 [Acanthamoeba polyphaga moumouvirus]AGC01813.1 Uracil-DNA glycosylase family 1 [Acanthamoeba polyphaga moumouvirus]AQN68165.1 uracil-DNA glycosylase family [Saudi moumouvirus]